MEGVIKQMARWRERASKLLARALARGSRLSLTLSAALVLATFALAGGCAKKKTEPPPPPAGETRPGKAHEQGAAGRSAEAPAEEAARPSPPGETGGAGPYPPAGSSPASGETAGEAWNPFNFRAGQYFKYAVTLSEEGKKKTGWFSLELKPAGADQVEAVWQGELEGQKFSFRQTGPTEQVTNPASVMFMAAMSGPAAMPVLMAAGATVFVPWYPLAFAGQALALGAGWEVTEPSGERFSVKVVSRCEEAGLKGYLVRLDSETKEEKGRIEACVAPRSPLALSTRVWSEGELKYEAVLQEQRGL